jgi:seryl-tRNA synthetase
MYDIKWIRDNQHAFDAGLRHRNGEPLSDKFLALDDTRKAAILKAQGIQERRNALSKEIGQAMAAKDGARAEALKAEVAGLKDQLAQAEAQEKAAVAELDRELAAIANTPLAEVPVGADEHANVEIRRVGEPRTQAMLGFAPKQHFEIGEALGLMDFEAAGRMSGARFVVLKGALARLERALGQFMLDVQTGDNDYTEVNPPLLVRDEAMFGTAQLPKFVDEQFTAARTRTRQELLDEALRHATRTELESLAAGRATLEDVVAQAVSRAPTREDFWLIPTAEVPLTNLVREQILDESALPLRYTALTPCFRAEAGAAGRDTRGMIRQHQFNKVELVSITTPEQSLVEHDRMTQAAESILQRLGLAYRTMLLSTGDMGFASQKTYDIEVWLPGQDAYREISSCSVCGDFQARRMNARYRDARGKPRFVHTLNGSGVAVGRALVAVLENYQNVDGSITVPDALIPYMGGLARIEKA